MADHHLIIAGFLYWFSHWFIMLNKALTITYQTQIHKYHAIQFLYGSPHSHLQRPLSFWSLSKNRDLWPHFLCLSANQICQFLQYLVLGAARGLDSWCWPKGLRPLGTRMGFSHTVVKLGVCAQFLPKLSLNKDSNFRNFWLKSTKLKPKSS